METKKCSKCGMELPIEMFHVSKNSKDGRQTMCKSCKSEYSKAKTEARKRKIDEATRAIEQMAKDGDSITLSDGTVLRKVKQDCKPLSDYLPRELFAELKRRGYQWPDGTIFIKQFVNYNNI